MSSHVACRSREPLPFGATRQRASALEPALAETARLTARIAGLLTAAVLAIGVGVHLAAADWARRLLAFHFPGVPAQPAVAAEALLHNLRALVAIGGALLVAQSPYLVTRAARPGRIHGAQGACEALLAGAVAANVIVIGASFGAWHGARGAPARSRSSRSRSPSTSRADAGHCLSAMCSRSRPVDVRARAAALLETLRERMRSVRLLFCIMAIAGSRPHRCCSRTPSADCARSRSPTRPAPRQSANKTHVAPGGGRHARDRGKPAATRAPRAHRARA